MPGAGGIDTLRALWRRAVPRGLRHRAGVLLQPLVIEATLRQARSSFGSAGAGPPALVGFFTGASGIALSAQFASRALDHLGIQHRRVEVGDLRAPEPPDSPASTAWMFHLNPPELLIALNHWRVGQVSGPRFGCWAWELPQAPPLWLRTARVMDGVMAPSAYTADALGGARTALTVTPHPLFAGDFAGVSSHAERPHGEAFRAVAMFDFKSSAARKNPEGAMAAFAAAFGHDPSVRLVIKTHNTDFAPEAARRLREQAGPNVEFVDAVWDRAQVLSFIASADAFLSLHRAEGFGLTLAEAMMLGTPVVATGWSGNLAFMDADSACLVPSRLVPIEDPQGIYRGQVWAEPDVGAAAQYLRRLRDDRAFANSLAERAKRQVIRTLSPEAWFESLPPALKAALFASPHSVG